MSRLVLHESPSPLIFLLPLIVQSCVDITPPSLAHPLHHIHHTHRAVKPPLCRYLHAFLHYLALTFTILPSSNMSYPILCCPVRSACVYIRIRIQGLLQSALAHEAELAKR